MSSISPAGLGSPSPRRYFVKTSYQKFIKPRRDFQSRALRRHGHQRPVCLEIDLQETGDGMIRRLTLGESIRS